MGVASALPNFLINLFDFVICSGDIYHCFSKWFASVLVRLVLVSQDHASFIGSFLQMTFIAVKWLITLFIRPDFGCFSSILSFPSSFLFPTTL